MPEMQVSMLLKDLSNLPEVVMPPGYGLRTYMPGDEEAWVRMMNHELGEWTVDSCRERLTGDAIFLPDGLFFVTHEGELVGSACAWRYSENEWTRGCLHMVCVLPGHRGKQLGYLVTLAVLHFFHERGFREVLLNTSNLRIPAIKSYLRLGFEPCYFDDEHRECWQAIFSNISEAGG